MGISTSTSADAYFAGLLEGDGYIGAARSKVQTTRATVELTLTDKAAIECFQIYVNTKYANGKPIKIRYPRPARANHKETFKVGISGKKAEYLIRDLYKYWFSHRKNQSEKLLAECGLPPVSGNEDNEIFRGLPWLAGLLDAEGCFKQHKTGKYTYPQIQLEMTCRDIVTFVADWVNREIPPFTGAKKGRPEQIVAVLERKRQVLNRKNSFCLQINGRRAIYLAALLKPHIRNSDKLDDVHNMLVSLC